MAIKVSSATFPACWASALVNGDFSGLNEIEAAACGQSIEAMRRAGWSVVDVERDAEGNGVEPRFTRCFDMYGGTAQGGDVLDYVVHRVTR